MHLFDYTGLFKGITVPQRQLIMLSETICNYGKGEKIFSEGDKASDIYCLVDGHVKLYKVGMDRVQIVRLFPRHECFGYPAFFTGGVHKLTAMAMTEVTLIKAPMRVVRKIISENGKVGLNFTTALTNRLASIDDRVVSLTQKHVRGRLAEALLLMMETYGRDLNTGVMDCIMSRDDIASFANMTTATAIRTLSVFCDEDVIEFVGKGIRILNQSKLEKISNMG